MAKSIAKLFRDPESALQAVTELLAHDYKKEEIGLLMRLKDGRRLLSLLGEGATAQLSLPQVGEVTALGALARTLSQEPEASQALAKVINTSPESYGYYEFGLRMGGVLVTVHGEEAHLGKALRLLRSSVRRELAIGRKSANPGFNTASRMTTTDPLDAKMTGDFRRY